MKKFKISKCFLIISALAPILIINSCNSRPWERKKTLPKTSFSKKKLRR